MLLSVPRDAPPVRLATPDDEETLVEMVRAMHEDDEFGMINLDGTPTQFSRDKARLIIQRATQVGRNAPDAGQAWIGVIGGPGALTGSAYVTLQEPSMSEGRFLSELWSWVFPHLRDTSASEALLGFSTGLADAMGLRLFLASMTQRRLGKGRFYARRFGSPVGNIYTYTPSPDEADGEEC